MVHKKENENKQSYTQTDTHKPNMRLKPGIKVKWNSKNNSKG